MKKYFKIKLFIIIMIISIFSIFIINNNKIYQEKELITASIKHDKNINLLSIYIEDENGYKKQDNGEIPESGYTLDTTKSICSNSVVPSWDMFKKELSIDNLNTEGTSCYLYFKKLENKEQTLVDLGVTPKGNLGNSFTGTSCESGCDSSENGVYETEDDYGTTYYYRGTVNNNWVKLGTTYWRIIRINGNGTIRLIYNGSSATQNGVGTMMNSASNIQFNSSYSDNTYVGYMYGQTGGTDTTKTHTNEHNSTVLETIVTWYNSNLKDNYEQYIDGETGFCGDREIATSTHGQSNYTNKGYGTERTYYAPYDRFHETNSTSWGATQNPKLECTNPDRDLYTTVGSSRGNKKLPVPVGLITADEVVYAGGFVGSSNSGYYLYNNQNYWTMSPYNFDGSYAYVFVVDSYGNLYNNIVNNTRYGVRPVINLKAGTKFRVENEDEEKGTSTNPFIVEGAE